MTFVIVEPVLFAKLSALIAQLWMADEAAVLVTHVLFAPQASFFPKFGMTDEALVFIRLVLVAIEALRVDRSFGSETGH